MEAVPSALLLAAMGGILIGFFLSVFGGGGSVLATPWLIYIVGIADTHIAIGTSATAVTINAALGLMGQARMGEIRWPCAIIFAIFGLSGSFAGASLAKQTDGQVLLIWFALAMGAIAISMLIPRKNTGSPDIRFYPRMTLRLAPIALVAGFAAGFFGIGGGFLIAPGLMAATGMTLSNAMASSLVSVSVFGAATSTSYAYSQLVDWSLVAALVVGGGIGTLAGLPAVRLLAKKQKLARQLFALMVLAVATFVGWSATI